MVGAQNLMNNSPLFKSYRDSIIIKNHLRCSHILVGDYSYYAGYYEGKPFEECVLYLDEMDNEKEGLDRLVIGKFCSIVSGVKFMLGGNQGHEHAWISTYPLDAFDADFDGFKTNPPKAFKPKGDTAVGNDVWIGTEAMLMPGVHMGDGAVIAARSGVTKSVGPYEIWGENPARLIKSRFSPDHVQKLLEIKWWDWDIAI
jgi:chloramphenicol O-acetyltransferase type B